MSIQIKSVVNSDIVSFRVTGKLVKEDFQRVAIELEKFTKSHGNIYLLLEMQDFEGWEMEALWERIKLEFKHFDDIERVAVVAEKKWQEFLDQISSPFTIAKTRYFMPGESDQALIWLKGDRELK